MQDYAKKVDEKRTERLYGSKGLPTEAPKEEEAERKDAKFLKDLNKQVYLDSDMKLEERINRNAHYVARGALADE